MPSLTFNLGPLAPALPCPAPQAFARLSAVYGGTYMLNKPDIKVVYDEAGRAVGVESEGVVARAKIVVGDPSYFPDKTRLVAKVVRCVAIMVSGGGGGGGGGKWGRMCACMPAVLPMHASAQTHNGAVGHSQKHSCIMCKESKCRPAVTQGALCSWMILLSRLGLHACVPFFAERRQRPTPQSPNRCTAASAY